MAFSITISGTVEDQSSDPVAGMTVELVRNDTQVVDTDVTDSGGDFSVSHSGSSGDYFVRGKAKTPHYAATPSGPVHVWDGLSDLAFDDDLTSQLSNNNPSRGTIGDQSFEEDSGVKSVTRAMSDPDAGDTLTIQKLSGPSWITFTKVSNTQYRMNVDTNNAGATPAGSPYAVSYKINDNFGGSSTTENLDVSITSGNEPPEIDDPGAKQYQHNSGVQQFQLTATDPEMDPITFSLFVSSPPSVTGITTTPGGLVSVDTDALDRVIHNVTYRAADDDHPLGDAIANTIEILNNAPVLTNPGTQNFDQDRGDETFQLVATDADNDALSYSKVSGEAWATVDPDTGLVTVNTNGLAPGTYPHTWEVDDGNGGTDQETHDIVIGPINHPPDLENPGSKAYDSDTGVQQFQLVADDEDVIDTLTFSKVSGPSWVTVDAAGLVSADTTGVQGGAYQVTMRVTDDGTPNLSDDESFTIFIDGPPDDIEPGWWYQAG